MKAERVKLSDQIRQGADASGMSRYRICQTIGIAESTMSRFMSGQGLSMKALDARADLLRLEVTTNKRRSRPKNREEG